MKNFSAKTADFDSISISGEAPIVQSDLGTAPNQIPLNKDLGTLAYMDSSGVEDVNADTIELREIAAELSETAVDVFVYDTRKDSDGGAWRSRTSHTSWYNEELNTATRGGRREFPAVAVIVEEANKVTIYDGDDPDLSMWMVFNASGGRMIWATQLSCVSSLNARLSIGSPASGFRYIDFVSDKMREWRANGVNSISGDISERNSGNLTLIDIPGQDVIVNQIINDVAMTVLPNAPINTETGLPIPTIAVATDGGVSVIRDDGSVVDISGGAMKKVSFDLNNQLHLGRKGNNFYYYGAVPSGDVAEGDWRVRSDVLYVGGDTADIQIGDNDIVDIVPGVIGLDDDVDSSLVRLDINKNSLSESMINFTNSRYNTGWMPGDIKLATLSDTKVEKVGVDESAELVTNGEFDSNIDGWTAFEHAGSTPTIEHDSTNGGRLKVTMTGSYTGATQTINNIKSGRYVVSANFVAGTHSNFYIQIAITGEETYLTNAVDLTNTNPQLEFDVPAGTTSIDVRVRGAVGSGIFYADNISVKQTGELVTNVTFDNGTTGWTGLSGGVLSIDNGRLKIEETTDAADAYAVNSSVISTVVGKKYIITWQFIKGTNGRFATRFGKSGNQSQDYKSNATGEYTDDGYYSFEFTATGTELNLSFIVNDRNAYGFVDNISVRLAEDDRSVNDNGLQIFGEIDKTPVAPGADLVAYSGFSANNYLMQPYNSDLEIFRDPAGSFCIMGWIKTNGSTNGRDVFFSTGTPGTAGTSRSLSAHAVNGLAFFGWGADYDSFSSNQPLSQGAWHNFCFVYNNGNHYWYVNGEQSSVTYKPLLAYSGNPAVKIGDVITDNTTTRSFNGELSLLRVSDTIPSSEQIAKIYRDEKVLFQDGAQATLYGTSDSVTALAYDDSENLLHVGTASGRSSFNGLKRVENTDVAVTTAISATEGLVIEQ
jgi:hypothetical protein